MLASRQRTAIWKRRRAGMRFQTRRSHTASEDLTASFAKLADEWRKETSHISSVETIAMHPAYQRIIGMGPAALPLILKEMARETDHWFWALHAITGENPIPEEDAGYMDRMTQAWLNLGHKRGWI